MSSGHDEASRCAQVLDRLVEGDDLSGDRLLAEHLGSCVTCFRALTDLRDAPRVAEALRAEVPVVPHPGDRFWDDLATRTTAAAQVELHRALQGAVRGGETPEANAPLAMRVGRRRSPGARARIISVAVTLAAAAAGFMLIARGPLSSPSEMPAVPAALGSAARDGTASPAPRSLADEAATDDEADVAELDVGALHRLLDRLRPHAPAALTTPSGGGAGEAADALGDDEVDVAELADLDGDELRRVASSLEAGVF